MSMMNNKTKKNLPFSVVENDTLHKGLNFVATEQYKLLRTNIIFTLPEGLKCPVIGVTSSTRGEGKSTTAVNLSYVIAENGSRVLLIDGDLRIPSIARKLKIRSKPGLTDMIVNPDIDLEKWKSKINENWYVIPSGQIPPNPSELLSSARMSKLLDMLKEHFDYIVVDLPPVNLVSDAVSISGLLDGMILVVREDYATKKDLEQCFKQMRLSKVNLLGCLMNDSSNGANFYGRYSKSKKQKFYKYHRYDSYESIEDDNEDYLDEAESK